MAKYDVTFSCGHTQEIKLLGKEKDRRRKIEYFERVGLCRACYFGQTRKQAEKAAGFALPPLKGSEKQNHWAENIRCGFVQKTKNYKKEIKRDIVPIAEELLKEICEQQIKSSWWIARRESNYLFPCMK